MLREAVYQRALKGKLETMFPGCFIFENDPDSRQGIPDLLVLFGDRWAMLEVKRSQTSPVRPNQEYYVNLFSTMSFSCFIYPENEDEVLQALYGYMQHGVLT